MFELNELYYKLGLLQLMAHYSTRHIKKDSLRSRP